VREKPPTSKSKVDKSATEHDATSVNDCLELGYEPGCILRIVGLSEKTKREAVRVRVHAFTSIDHAKLLSLPLFLHR
jgi:hypothetical protein